MFQREVGEERWKALIVRPIDFYTRKQAEWQICERVASSKHLPENLARMSEETVREMKNEKYVVAIGVCLPLPCHSFHDLFHLRNLARVARGVT